MCVSIKALPLPLDLNVFNSQQLSNSLKFKLDLIKKTFIPKYVNISIQDLGSFYETHK